MKTATIRQQLQSYLEVADEKKINAIYTMVEDDIKENMIEYSPELKFELDSRVNNYLDGVKTISPVTMNKRPQTLRKKMKK